MAMARTDDDVDNSGFTPFDLTWNAACGLPTSAPAEHDLEGDRTLRQVLSFHSLVMNGGLEHAISDGPGIHHQAPAGYRQFGLEAVADLVERGIDLVEHPPSDLTNEALDSAHEELDDLYSELLPSDEVLVVAVRRYWDEHTDQFADRP
jgi:hypothetical protein